MPLQNLTSADGRVVQDMRHTAATLALERGESIKAVAADAGRYRGATVMRVYEHATPLMQESLTATMDSLLTGSEASLHDNLQSDEDEGAIGG